LEEAAIFAMQTRADQWNDHQKRIPKIHNEQLVPFKIMWSLDPSAEISMILSLYERAQAMETEIFGLPAIYLRYISDTFDTSNLKYWK
jgi:hypothetical protein